MKTYEIEGKVLRVYTNTDVRDKVVLIYNPPEAKDCSVSTNLFN